MLERIELDKQALEEELSGIGDCHKYKPTRGCVNGENLK